MLFILCKGPYHFKGVQYQMKQNQFTKHFIGKQFSPLFITKPEERAKEHPKDSICTIIFVGFAQKHLNAIRKNN